MISDAGRRKIVARLRNLAHSPEEIGIPEHTVIRALGMLGGFYDDCCKNEDVLALADLIDRPTTTRHGKFRTKYGRETPCCEVCGYSIGDMRWGYCPKCEAVIADD